MLPGLKEKVVEVQQVLANLVIETCNLLSSKHQNHQTCISQYRYMIEHVYSHFTRHIICYVNMYSNPNSINLIRTFHRRLLKLVLLL